MKKQAGFTLLELLVVVLIIGVLAAIALPQYQKAVVKAQFVQLVITFNALVQAQRAYYLEHGVYATELSQLDMTTPLTTTVSRCYASYNSNPLCYFRLKRDGANVLSLQQDLTSNRKICCGYPPEGPWGDALCSELAKTDSWYNGCISYPDPDACHCYKF